MRFPRLLSRVVAAAALVTLASMPSYAQQQDPGDEPGLIADDGYVLPPEWQKQMVYFRTTEAPGTIIVDPGNYYVYRIEGEGMVCLGVCVATDFRKAKWSTKSK